jgi:dolichol-phosphate mannosyltransferase
VCVVIPVLNENGRISSQLDRMRQVAGMPDVILADGGSSDGSTEADLLAVAGVNTILVKTGPGRLSAQLRMGFAYALDRGYDGIITVDGNNKDGVAAVPQFVTELGRGMDFVQGSRFVPGGVEENTPRLRRLAIRFIHAPIVSRAAGFRYTDTTNGFRGHSRRLLEHPAVQPFRNEFSDYALLPYLAVRAAQVGLNVAEIPVRRSYPPDVAPPTKITKFGGHGQLLRDLWMVWRGLLDPDCCGQPPDNRPI